jgi:hypothetical protein
MHKIERNYLLMILLILSITLLMCSNENNVNDMKNKTSLTRTTLEIDTNHFERIKIKLGKKEREVSLSYGIIKQKIKSRIWKKNGYKEDFSIGGISDTIFYYPIQIRTDASANIYVLDMQDNSVVKLTPEGKLIRKFGRKGKGPGEFYSAFRMDVTPDGKIIVLDPNLNKCAVFDGEKIFQIQCNLQPLGICFNNESEFSTLQLLNPLDDVPISRYSFSGEKLKDYQNLLFTKSFDDIVVGALPFIDGDIYGAQNDNLIYIPLYMNHFIKYNSKGFIEYARNTMDFMKLPYFERESYDIVSFKFPKELISVYRSSFSNNQIYIVSNLASSETSNGYEYVIDVYNGENGDYLFSFKLFINTKMVNIHITKNKIYVLKETSELSVYSYNLKG